MRKVVCNNFGSVLREEWTVISTGRWARARLRRWSEAEPALAELGSLSEVVDAIAVPIGHPKEFSLAVTQALVRLAADDPLATRLLLQVMIPILAKECFRSLRILESQGVRVEDSELVTVVLGSATDAIASLAGSTPDWPLRILRRRTIIRIVRCRDHLVANSRELAAERLPDVASPVATSPPAVVLARTLRLAVGKGIVSADDAQLVWVSTHRGETSLSLAQGDVREAERLRRRRSRAQRRLADHRAELLEVMAV